MMENILVRRDQFNITPQGIVHKPTDAGFTPYPGDPYSGTLDSIGRKTSKSSLIELLLHPAERRMLPASCSFQCGDRPGRYGRSFSLDTSPPSNLGPSGGNTGCKYTFKHDDQIIAGRQNASTSLGTRKPPAGAKRSFRTGVAGWRFANKT